MGWVIRLVASSLPPMPVSNNTTSQASSLKYKNAAAVSISKEVGCGSPFSVSVRQAVFTFSIKAAYASSETAFPFICQISR